MNNTYERIKLKETSISSTSLELLRICSVKIVCRLVKKENIAGDTPVNTIDDVIINMSGEPLAGSVNFDAERRMIDLIQDTMNIGGTFGSTVEINAFGIPGDLGSLSYDRKFDYRASGVSNLSNNMANKSDREPDTCSIPAIGVVCENYIFKNTKLFLEEFTGDSIGDIRSSNNFHFEKSDWR
jgi:hypothetical protein